MFWVGSCDRRSHLVVHHTTSSHAVPYERSRGIDPRSLRHLPTWLALYIRSSNPTPLHAPHGTLQPKTPVLDLASPGFTPRHLFRSKYPLALMTATLWSMSVSPTHR